MSAIIGIYQINEEPINLQHGQILMKQLRKYPADDIRTWHSEKVFLGCHAQWITPESVGEQLPLFMEDIQCTITADAIIDNRKELFEKLQIEPSQQKQMTDSLLILLAYDKWGEDTPKYLIGDFAFMIWDQKHRKLFGARDFSGSRTLYFHKSQKNFVFCTTIAPLLCLPYIEKKLNEQWLAEYLAIGGMLDAVDSGLTPYKSIEQLPPSHSITIENHKVTSKRYSYLTQGKRLKLKSDDEYVEAFQSVFQEAVVSRLRTHRKVGAQLSGGLDSGAVAGFAAKKLQMENRPLHTFSYIPPEDFEDFTPQYLLADERTFIKSTVDYVGGIIDHYCDFKGKDSYSEIDDFLDIMEMPYKFFENSFWLKGMFEKAHEVGVGVLLNGDRGNFSISWGNAFHYFSLLLKRLKWVSLFKELDQYSRNVGGRRLHNLPLIARIGFPIIDKIFPQGMSYQLPTLINPNFAEKTGVFAKFKEYGIDQTGQYSSCDSYQYRKRHFKDIFQWNAGNTLTAKLSLHYALWKRDPTNDLRVIRFCLSLPEEQYVQNGMDRALIRRAAKNYLPDKVRLNQRIRGVQGVDWVHRMIPNWDHFMDEFHQLSTNQSILKFLDGQLIKQALAKAGEGVVSPEKATDPNYKLLMRSLIVSRFLNQFT